MNEREILELALEGAKEKLAHAADIFTNTRTSVETNIENIRTALAEYDEIKERIEKEK